MYVGGAIAHPAEFLGGLLCPLGLLLPLSVSNHLGTPIVALACYEALPRNQISIVVLISPLVFPRRTLGPSNIPARNDHNA